MKSHNCVKSWRGKFSLLLTACLFTIPFAVVTAKDLTWTGSTGTNSNAWDNALTYNWVLRGTTTQATFADGDNVLIESGKYVEPSLMMTRRNRSGDVVFNIAAGETFSFGWNSNGKNGLHVDTKSFTKRGKGTLLLRSDLSGLEKGGSGDTTYGNAMTCGVDIVEGQIACKNRNSHNYLGPRTIPYWVYIRDGAALSFLQGNQTGAADSSECGIKIQLDEGGRLNIVTNAVDTETQQINSLVCVNTLKLAGGDIAVGDMVYQEQAQNIGLKSILKIFNTLWFSGTTPHAFGYDDGTYPGYKHYSSAGTFKSKYVSLESGTPVEFSKLDYITVVKSVYGGQAPARFLGSFAPFVLAHLDKSEYAVKLVESNFRNLFERTLSQYRKDLPVGVVGGFGYACKDVLARMGKEYGVTFSRFMSTPTEGLVEYHAL